MTTTCNAPDGNTNTDNIIGRLVDISKSFGDVAALKSVSLDIRSGETLAIVGENGAGKTTLMNVLFGLLQADSGNLEFKGKTVLHQSASQAIDAGFGMVHQHFMLYPSLTVIENILVGAEGVGLFGLIDFKSRTKEVAALINEFGFNLDPLVIVQDLSVDARQQLEIVKMIYRGAEVIILDEPTAVLTPQESISLFYMLEKLKADGKSIITITHKLSEVMENADRVVVMRSGKKIAERLTRDTNKDALSQMMVGREITAVNKTGHIQDEEILRVDRLTVKGPGNVPLLDDISVRIRAGEIVGIAGVSNNGQKSFVDALVGLRPIDNGQILLCQNDITSNSIDERRQAGLAYLAEDRMSVGLAVNGTVAENTIASRENASPYSGRFFMNPGEISNFSNNIINHYDIRTTGPAQQVADLSGGNKQKIIVGRELSGSPKLVVAENPTWGVDIGAISFIHQKLLACAEQGAAVIFLSAELEELFELSDRLLVFYQGKISAEFTRSELDVHEVGKAMSGVSDRRLVS